MVRRSAKSNDCRPLVLLSRPLLTLDIWSAGVIFFVLLCGFPPYEAQYFADSRVIGGTRVGGAGAWAAGSRGELDTVATLSSCVQQCDAHGR